MRGRLCSDGARSGYLVERRGEGTAKHDADQRGALRSRMRACHRHTRSYRRDVQRLRDVAGGSLDFLEHLLPDVVLGLRGVSERVV
jgi:hypothetical protein